ncbi:hypothetical protein ACH5RR_035525 [Cinchona calisaya]|uniref:Uncharacterized protein n=1 Tax=Cinchona calisaya TaxID=153742 RepID=A0ABD2Y222_9GENT
MAKRRREKVSDGPITAEEECYTAFIDTSLGTHLATIIYSSDTVFDLKKKIECEHSQLFPRIGEIKVLSLQVKQKGHFYHLPDSMLVFSAYGGSKDTKRHKFLFVDASSSEEHDREQHSGDPNTLGHFGLLQLENCPHVNEHNLLLDDPSKAVSFVRGSASGKMPSAVQASPRNINGEISKAIEMEVSPIDDDCQRELSSDITRKSGHRVRKQSLLEHVKHIQLESLEPLFTESGHTAKKRKPEHSANAQSDSVVKANNTSSRSKRSSSDHEIVNINTESSLVDAGKSFPSTREVRQKEFSKDVYRTSSSDIYKIAKSGAPTSQSEPAAEKFHKVGSEELIGDNSDTSSMKLQSTNVNNFASLKVTSQAHDENIRLDSLDSVANQTDRKGKMEMALNHDHQIMPSERCKFFDEDDADGTSKESILMPKLIVTSGPIEILTSDVTKRRKSKKRKKKSAKEKASSMQTDSVGEQTNKAGANSSDVPNLNDEDHVRDNIDKNESMLPPTETDETNKVEEERCLSANQGLQGKTSECFKPTDRGEAEVSAREAVISTNVLGSNEAMEVSNSPDKKRKKQKTKTSAAKVQDISGTDHDVSTTVGISLPLQAVSFNNQINDYSTKGESNVARMETDQTTAIAGDRGLSVEHETDVPLPTGYKSLNPDVDNSATNAMLPDAKDVKSSSRRKKKGTTKSAIIDQDGSGTELANTLYGFSAVTDSPANNVADETKNPQRILSQNVWTEASKDESLGGSASGAHVDGDEVTHEAVLLPSIEIYGSQENGGDVCEIVREVLENNRSQIDTGIHDLPVEGQTNELPVLELDQSGGQKENDRSVNKKAKKKKRKNLSTAAEIISSSEIKGPNIVAEELTTSGVKSRGPDKPFSATKTSGLAERTQIKSTTSDLEFEKNAGIESNSSNPKHARKDASPSGVPLKESPETEIDNENNIETAKGEEEGINFRHYFVPGQHQTEVTSVKVKEKSQSLKPKKKKEKHNVVCKSDLNLSENHENENKSDGKNVDDNQVEESASSDEHNRDLLRGKKSSKAPEDGVEAPSSKAFMKDGGVKTLPKPLKLAVANGNGSTGRTVRAWLEENKGSLTAPSSGSSSKGSKKVVQNTSKRMQKSSFNRNAGDVLNNSGQEKSLLTAPRSIFRDFSSESSGDENKIANSDASTRTPSDSSSSSGYSVGESELSQVSKRNGSDTATTKGGGGNNILNSKFSGPGQMTMDMVLRSSSRFKKAKLSASQSRAQAGVTESHPVDFVPDSQANP